MQTLKTSIQTLITDNALQSGQSIYWKHSEFSNDLGDESGIHYLAYTSNRPYKPSEEQEQEYETKEELICSSIINLDITQFEPYTDYTKIEMPTETAFISHWGNRYGDYIRIQISDHSIHITQFFSGQY